MHPKLAYYRADVETVYEVTASETVFDVNENLLYVRLDDAETRLKYERYMDASTDLKTGLFMF